jgi:hypothetical protein
MNYDEFIKIARQIRPNVVMSTTLPSREEWGNCSYQKQSDAFDAVKTILKIQTIADG